MPTVNETLLDEQIAHSESMIKYSNGVVNRIIALLNRVDASIALELSEALDRLPADSFSVQRLESLLGSVRSLNASAYAGALDKLQEELLELAGYETGFQFELFKATLPQPVLIHYPLAQVTASQVYAAAMARPFQGKLLREWAQGIEESRLAKIRNAVREGYVQGKTVDQIVRGIRGSRAEQYADSLLNFARHDLASIVRTAINHTASVAREKFYAAKSDNMKAEVWRSTLDTKTSDPCRIRDSLKYEALTHKPIGHKVKWLQGPGRIHFNCPSTSSPVTKSCRELGIDSDERTATERASMDGAVPADTTYAEWIQRQSYARQEQVLGVTRAQLMRDGAKLSDFYSPSGEWLTIDQLKERDKAAFARIAA
ncbi:hypothetical protein [Pseudomonas sp. S9]|uniref:hypothetical protein n=1 Tax=Pseudomonas sp. S9 TaxID=686578 RepID=UPI0002556DF6|nr:hypothetical protein [Pseudomonas sp. S9]